MKMYFIEPGEVAVCIMTNVSEAAQYVAKELGLVGVSKSLFDAFRVSHGEKTLVL